MTQTLKQFINQWSNQLVEEVDTNALNQCKDLAQRYIKNVWGLPYLPFGNAGSMFALAQNELYTKVINTWNAIPKSGDVVVWGTRYGFYGHIGVVVSANLFWFTAFVQNDPFKNPCIIKRYSYFGVTGWFRPKKVEKPLIDRVNEAFRLVYGRNPSVEESTSWQARIKDFDSFDGSVVPPHKSLVNTMRYKKSQGSTLG